MNHMCRFLLFKSPNPVMPQEYLEEFGDMAKKSRAFDGDWQGDGWGISWLDEKGSWKLYRSLKPIWQDVQSFNRLGMTKLLAIHARSASFAHHKDNIEFNQPYIDGNYAFVFNGFIKGVNMQLPGSIGAQKIWHLLRKLLEEKNPVDALKKVKNIFKKNAREIQALNIGLSDGRNIYSLSYFTSHPEYYRLHYLKSKTISLICSEPIGSSQFDDVASGSILSF